MGVYERPGHSKFWWMHLEPTNGKPGRRVRTDILVGTTSQQRKDSKPLAIAEYHRQMNGGATDDETTITLAKYAPWFEANKLAHREGAERDISILHTHLLPFFGSEMLAAITPTRVADYQTYRKHFPTVIEHFGGAKGKKRTLKPPCHNTINREVDVLKQALAAAVPAHLKASPLAGMPKFKTNDRPIVVREMTEAEFERLLQALPIWDQCILLIGRDALMRATNILDLKKTDLKVEPTSGRRYFDVRKPKGGKPYRAYLSQRILALLATLPTTTSEYLFPQRRGAKTARDRRNALTRHLRRTAARVRVPWGRDTGGNTFHWATRSTGTTRMLDQGGEGVIGAVIKQGGWSVRSQGMVLERYKQTKDRHVFDVIDRLDKANAEAARKTRQVVARKTNAKRGRAKVGRRRKSVLAVAGGRR